MNISYAKDELKMLIEELKRIKMLCRTSSIKGISEDFILHYVL
jgi:hypothetical protein